MVRLGDEPTDIIVSYLCIFVNNSSLCGVIRSAELYYRDYRSSIRLKV